MLKIIILILLESWLSISHVNLLLGITSIKNVNIIRKKLYFMLDLVIPFISIKNINSKILNTQLYSIFFITNVAVHLIFITHLYDIFVINSVKDWNKQIEEFAELNYEKKSLMMTFIYISGTILDITIHSLNAYLLYLSNYQNKVQIEC
tara:strand:+ start:113 stop:559 length:447 start_codon:yes stop_codon:yes gene_type:complete